MYRIFIVEDDPGIAGEVSRQMASWGMEARCAQNFRAVMEEFEAFQPHLVVLDITLPFYNGYHWCQEIRRRTRTPILFLSSAADNMNMIMAINLGADDFIAKPFDMGVLMAKVSALLRRAYDFGAPMNVLRCREAELDVGEGTLRCQGRPVPLSKNEYRILLTLMENRGSVVSREKLMEKLWQTDSFVDENTLTVNVGRLRKKLENAGMRDLIQTKFGVGYWISREE